MTVRELAALLKLSPSTVSKALSGSDEIPQSTKDFVTNAARESGYLAQRSGTKLGGRKPREPLVCVTVPEFRSEYYLRLLEAFEKKLTENGAFTLAAVGGMSQAESEHALRSLARLSNIDGFIIVEPNFSPDDAGFGRAPVVIVSNIWAQSRKYDTVKIDFYQGIYEAVKHFTERGHRRIGFIGEANTLNKEAAFLRAVSDLGLSCPPEYVFRSEERFGLAGRDGIDRLTALDSPPTAVLCAYDYIALGTIKEARALGLRVPEELSVVGSDDIPASSYDEVGLTTIRTFTNSLCDISISILLKKLRSPDISAVQNVSIKTGLVERATVAKIG